MSNVIVRHLKLRQYSDQHYCAHCGKSWDINDPEPPACLPVKNSRDWIAELRNKLKVK